MERFREFVAWQNYAAEMLVKAEVAEHEAEARLHYVEAQALMKDWDGKGTVKARKAEIADDQEVEAASAERLAKYAERKYTKMIYDNCERSASLLSRELSRRIGREGAERRNARWST
jgi:hypothetical protein